MAVNEKLPDLPEGFEVRSLRKITLKSTLREARPDAYPLYEAWWRALTRIGDPDRMAGLEWEAFRAGWDLGRHTAPSSGAPETATLREAGLALLRLFEEPPLKGDPPTLDIGPILEAVKKLGEALGGSAEGRGA